MDDHKLNLPKANVYIIHRYVENTTEIFEYLKTHLDWLCDDRVPDRPYCHMGIDYIVSTGQLRKGHAFDTRVLDIMKGINQTFNVRMNSCYAMFYTNGNAELPYRSNAEPQLDLDQPVFSLGYGAPRNITFKDVNNSEEFEFLLTDGDLMIMSDKCQRNYLYSVKKSMQYTEPRISLGFRHFQDVTSF